MFAQFKDNDGNSFSKLVFHHPNRWRLVRDVKIVLMQLFASGILVPRPVSKKPDGTNVPTNVRAYLGYNRTGTPLFQVDDSWAGLPLISDDDSDGEDVCSSRQLIDNECSEDDNEEDSLL